jgi:hypothetical protein
VEAEIKRVGDAQAFDALQRLGDPDRLAHAGVIGRVLARHHILTRCNVIGEPDGGVTDCNVADAYVLDRFVAGRPVTVGNTCQAFTGP